MRKDTANVQAAPVTTLDPALAEKTKDGLVFKVQIGVYGEDVPVDVLSKIVELGNVEKQELSGEARTRYTAGAFADFASAEKYLAGVKAKGLPGAIVIPVFNGKVIGMEEAAEMLK